MSICSCNNEKTRYLRESLQTFLLFSPGVWNRKPESETVQLNDHTDIRGGVDMGVKTAVC